MAETTCQPQFEAPHHLEWLIRRLSASSIFSSQGFCAGRPVRSWRRVLWFCRAPPRPVSRGFVRGWAGSRYRAEKRSGEPILYYYMSVYLEAHLLPSYPAVSRARGALQPCGASRGLPSFWRKSSPVGRIFRASRLALLPASARRVLPSVCVAPLPRCLSPRIERHRGLFPRVATDLLVTHLTCLPLARA